MILPELSLQGPDRFQYKLHLQQGLAAGDPRPQGSDGMGLFDDIEVGFNPSLVGVDDVFSAPLL